MSARNKIRLYLVGFCLLVAGLVYLIGPVPSTIIAIELVMFISMRYWINATNANISKMHENITANQKRLYKALSRIEEKHGKN